MDTTGILSIVAIVTSVGGTLLALVNHTRVRSICCGKKLEVSLDVEKTTPPSDKLEIKIPSDSKV
jgi:hypothetical protein